MQFEYDPRKATSNYRKHKVSFDEVEPVFYDARAIHQEDPHPEEDRWVIMGLGAQGFVLVVVYTFRDDTIRIISARRATRHEVQNYEG